jgi:uncharacterized protein involved in outer membrane biogenesis
MRRVRLALISLALAAALAVALAAALYGAARLSWSERRVSAWLSSSLGWPVQMGELALGYFPRPWVEIESLSFAEGPGTGAPAVVTIQHTRVELPWRAVLGRRAHLGRLELQSPQARLTVDAAGNANWSAFAGWLASLGGEEPFVWAVDELQVEAGGLDYLDEATGATARIKGLTLTGSGLRPARPFPLKLRAAAEGRGFVLHAAFDGEATVDFDRNVYALQATAFEGWLGGGGLGLAGVELAASFGALRADFPAGVADLRGLHFEGLGLRARGEAGLTGIGSTPVARFRVATDSFSPRAVAAALNRPLPAMARDDALVHARVEAEGGWDGRGLSLTIPAGELDDSRFSGSLLLTAAGAPPRVRLDVDKVDLDLYLPAGSPAASRGDTPRATLEQRLAALQALDVDAEVTVGEARTAGARARGLRVVIEPEPAAASEGPKP